MPAAAEKPPLTARQRRVFVFIVRHWGKRGNFPAVREIAAKVMKSRHPNAAVCHLKRLAAKGYIVWRVKKGARGLSRNIAVPELVELAGLAAKAFLVSVKE